MWVGLYEATKTGPRVQFTVFYLLRSSTYSLLLRVALTRFKISLKYHKYI